MAQEFEFAAPRTEEMMKVAAVGLGAGVTGAVEGVIVKMAPELGTMEPLATWGATLGIPAMGVALALFTRGLLSDLSMGIAAGGLGVIGYTLPELLSPVIPIAGRKAATRGNPGVKMLGAGISGAAQRAQQAAKVGIEF